MGASVSKTRDEVGRCIVALLLKEPFYGHLLAGVVRNITPDTLTAAVAVTSRGVELRVNPDFFMKELRGKNIRTAVIKHECLHLLFKHLFRFDNYRRHPLLFNIAADLVVNQLVKPWPLPDSAIMLSTFPDMGLLPDQTMDWYYKKLLKLQTEVEKLPKQCSGAQGGQGGQGGQSGQGGQGGQGQGQGGKDYSQTSAPQSAEVLDRLVGSSWHSDHQFWASAGSGEGESATGGAISDGVRRAIETELERLIIQAKDRGGSKVWGNMPGPLKSLIDAMIERRKPKISWKRVIRLFSNSSRRTRIVSTMHKISKRYGTFPGIKVKRYQKMAIAIDTSGSVPDTDLTRFFSEVHGIWRQGAEIDVIECDAAVQRVYKYGGKFPEKVAGRGGTVFDPVFKWLRDQRMVRYDGCIYLTDGGASPPTIKPPCKLLWVVTSDGMVGEHLKWGRTIQLPPE